MEKRGILKGEGDRSQSWLSRKPFKPGIFVEGSFPLCWPHSGGCTSNFLQLCFLMAEFYNDQLWTPPSNPPKFTKSRFSLLEEEGIYKF